MLIGCAVGSIGSLTAKGWLSNHQKSYPTIKPLPSIEALKKAIPCEGPRCRQQENGAAPTPQGEACEIIFIDQRGTYRSLNCLTGLGSAYPFHDERCGVVRPRIRLLAFSHSSLCDQQGAGPTPDQVSPAKTDCAKCQPSVFRHWLAEVVDLISMPS